VVFGADQGQASRLFRKERAISHLVLKEAPVETAAYGESVGKQARPKMGIRIQQKGTMVNKGSTLGGLIRILRQKHGWTLRQMSEKTGIPLSTLAKVEADKLSLTYDKLQQFTSRLGLSMTEFLVLAEAPAGGSPPRVFTARRSLTEGDNSIRIATPNYDYEYLCADLREKRMVPIVVRIRANDIKKFGDLVMHQGEEFIFVLEGTIEVHMQFYSPVTVKEGQGIYLDSSMGHAYVTKDCESALVLAVCSSEDSNLAGELISLAENEAKQTA
jgi:transcriptional regulator with XRE-family HTH domain